MVKKVKRQKKYIINNYNCNQYQNAKLSNVNSNHKYDYSIWGISWMCFFWSTSSVMVFSLLPTFITEVLGASKQQYGLVEGLAVFLAFASKIFTGIYSDYIKKRRPIIAIGSFLSIFGKVMFALSFSPIQVFIARGLDRVIKGIRSAPTEALIADISTTKNRASSFGIRQSLYFAGGIFGGLIASFLINVTNGNYRLVFAISTVPATIALLLLIGFIKEKNSLKLSSKKWDIKDIFLLPKSYWMVVLAGFFLFFARFSIGFLNIRARDLGFSIRSMPILAIAYEIAQAIIALPIGRLGDKYNKKNLLILGIIVLTIADLMIIFIPHKISIVLGMIIGGFHVGMTHGLLLTLIADNALPHMRGTAFAIYYIFVAISVCLGNIIAGYLSDISSVGPFFGGVVFTILSCIILVFSNKDSINIKQKNV